jgi:hypothetical protein
VEYGVCLPTLNKLAVCVAAQICFVGEISALLLGRHGGARESEWVAADGRLGPSWSISCAEQMMAIVSL